MGELTLALAKQVIGLNSNTPIDAGCQAILIKRLVSLRFTIEQMRHGQVDNLWAHQGQTSPLLCFAGHTYAVPTGPHEQRGSNPFTPEVRDSLLYGRGAADMKASLASFIVVTEDFLADHPHYTRSFAFLITSDEEGPATDGTIRVVETLAKRGEVLDFCIVGEPTSAKQFGDTIKNGRRGSLSGTLHVKGVLGGILPLPSCDKEPHTPS